MTQPAAEQPRRIPLDELTSDALDQLYAELDQLAAMSQRHLLRADRYGATLNEVLRLFIHKGHPGEPCLRTSWVPERKVELWRGVYGWSEPSIPCPDCGAPGPESELHLHQEAEQRARAERAEAALAALHEGEQPHDDERVVPTPAQWIWRWNRATPAERLQRVEQLQRAEAAIERVRAELHALNSEVRGLTPVALAGRRDAVARIRAALDEQQEQP